MKNLLAILCLLSISLSASAVEFNDGDQLNVGVDSERIVRGLKTGDFSCQGACLQISIDWSLVRDRLFGSKDESKKEIAYCISEYSRTKENLDSIKQMKFSDEVSASDIGAEIESELLILNIIHNSCKARLGSEEADRLRTEIFKQ